MNLVVQRDFADKNQRVLEQTLRALKKAIAFIQNDQESAKQIIARVLDKDQAFMKWIWPDFDFGLQLDQQLLITLEDEAKWAIGKKLVEQQATPNFFELIDMKPLKNVSPERVSIIH